METILYFHMGRGGRFYNGGHRTYCGKKNIGEVLSLCDSGKHWVFIHERDDKGRFCKPYYADQNGNFLIYVEDVKSGIGQLDWDGIYDTDICMTLSDCDMYDLNLVLDSNEWDKEETIKEYFDEHTELKVDWSKFDKDLFYSLILDFFNGYVIDVDEYYLVENEKN